MWLEVYFKKIIKASKKFYRMHIDSYKKKSTN